MDMVTLCRRNGIIRKLRACSPGHNYKLRLPCRFVQGHLKVEAFYRSRPVFRVSPQATHEKQEKRVFAGSDTLSPGQRSSRSGKGPAAPCNPAFVTFKSPCTVLALLDKTGQKNL